MSAEGGAIGAGVSAVGAVSAGPSVAVASPIGAGFTEMSGVGFNAGSATFSGLGRSDMGIESFSVNEGSRGPVSFSNSTDLFAETRTYSASLFSVPEGPVKGDIFDQTEIIAKAQPSVEPAKYEDLFSDFEPFIAEMPINEGPIPGFSLKDTASIAESIDISTPIIEPIFTNSTPEISVEEIVASLADVEIPEPDNSTNAVEDLKENDPLTYMQLKSDLVSVEVILGLIEEVGVEQEIATQISNSAVEIAVKRSGLIKAIETQAEPKSEEEQAQSKTSSAQTTEQAVGVQAQNQTEADIPVVVSKEEAQEPEFYVDEEANNARRKDTQRAIRQAFEEGDVDPETGKVKGKAVIERLPEDLPTDEVSEIVLKEGGRDDGSEHARRNQLLSQEFETVEEGLAVTEDSIIKNNAVTDEEAPKKATIAELTKVKGGIRPSMVETQIYPLAA